MHWKNRISILIILLMVSYIVYSMYNLYNFNPRAIYYLNILAIVTVFILSLREILNTKIIGRLLTNIWVKK